MGQILISNGIDIEIDDIKIYGHWNIKILSASSGQRIDCFRIATSHCLHMVNPEWGVWVAKTAVPFAIIIHIFKCHLLGQNFTCVLFPLHLFLFVLDYLEIYDLPLSLSDGQC